MKHVWFLILIVFFAAPASAQETISLPISVSEMDQFVECDPDNSHIVMLHRGTDYYYVPVESFASTILLPSNYVCRAFLRDWKKKLMQAKQDRIVFYLGAPDKALKEKVEASDDADAFVTHRLLNHDLEDACREMGYCESPLFGSLTVRADIRRCSPRFDLKRYFGQLQPRSRRPNYTAIENLDVSFFPFVSFSDVLDPIVAGTEPGGFINVSTLSVGQIAGETVSGHYQGVTKPMFLAADASQLLADGGTVLPLTFKDHPSIRLVPMSRTPLAPSFYHIKAGANDSNHRSFITSMNISNPQKLSYIDAAYSFDNPEIADELNSIMVSSMKDQCERESEFSCLVDFFEGDETVKAAWKDIFKNSCSTLERELQLHPLPEHGPKFFMQPQDTDIPFLVSQIIDEAQHEVFILTHQLTHEGVASAINRARKRGVAVYLSVGKESRVSANVSQQQPTPDNLRRLPHLFPTSHLRAIIVDRKMMLFATGNFTYSAMLDARELFAITHNRTVIDKVMGMGLSLLRAYDPATAKNISTGSDAQRQLVIAPNEVDQSSLLTPSERKLLNENSIELPTRWLYNYREIAPEARARLRGCGLNEIPIIRVEDFLSCLEVSDT